MVHYEEMNILEPQSIPPQENQKIVNFSSRFVSGWQRGFGITPIVFTNIIILITVIFYILGTVLVFFANKNMATSVYALTAIYVMVVLISLRLLLLDYSRMEDEYRNLVRRIQTVRKARRPLS